IPYLPLTLKIIYNSLTLQLILTPIILTLLKQYEAVNQYFMTILIAVIIGFLIYYFFPTSGPASVIFNKLFLPEELLAVKHFVRLHEYLPLHGGEIGLIGFPSFHVIWSVNVIYAFRKVKY